MVDPPVDDGCLPGVGRARLIAAGLVHERSFTRTELRHADGLALVSSLRGQRPAVLIDG